MWDESLYANNSLDLAKNGDWVSLNTEGVPNFDNVKPTLVIWLQALCIKIFGANEFSVRLPSIFSALFICICLYNFCKKYISVFVAFIAVCILLTTTGLVRSHVALSGDLDCIVLLFTTYYNLLFLEAIIKEDKLTHKFYFTFFITILLAFLSKGIAGFMPLVPLFLYTISNKKYKTLFFTYLTLNYLLFTLLVSTTYYCIREYLQNGYFNVVVQSELLRYTHNVMPWHNQNFYFYWRNLVKQHFLFYILLAPILFFPIVRYNGKIVKNYSIFFVVFYIVFISIPNVKLNWYDAPIYPFLAIAFGVSFTELYYLTKTKRNWIINSIISLVIVLLIFTSFINTYKFKVEKTDPLEKNGIALKKIISVNKYKAIDAVFMTASQPQFYYHLNFYIKALSYNKSRKVSVINNINELLKNQSIICESENDLKLLRDSYSYDSLTINGVFVYKILYKR